MNGLEAEKPQRLLDNALAFYEAGRHCSALGKASIPPFKEGVELHAPTVACHAFAIEQFLKLLLLLETGQYPDWEHKLDRLFELLSPGVKERIEGNFRNATDKVSYYLEQARSSFVSNGVIRMSMNFCWRRPKIWRRSPSRFARQLGS